MNTMSGMRDVKMLLTGPVGSQTLVLNPSDPTEGC
jgi:hypothetical protein